MRGVHLIVLCGVLVALGLGLIVLRRDASLPIPPSVASLAPAPTAAPQPPGDVRSASASLACIQEALGGVRLVTSVSSLRIVGGKKPTAEVPGPHPLAHQLEIGVQFPDRFKRQTVYDDAGMSMTTGFNGSELVANPAPPSSTSKATLLLQMQRSFSREMFPRLPRELPGVQLTGQLTKDAGQDRLAVHASPVDGLETTTLLADARTCMPVAVEYATRADQWRIDLSQYRRFGGILFATVRKVTRNGKPWEDEYDSEIRVNGSFDPKYFQGSERQR